MTHPETLRLLANRGFGRVLFLRGPQVRRIDAAAQAGPHACFSINATSRPSFLSICPSWKAANSAA